MIIFHAKSLDRLVHVENYYIQVSVPIRQFNEAWSLWDQGRSNNPKPANGGLIFLSPEKSSYLHEYHFDEIRTYWR